MMFKVTVLILRRTRRQLDPRLNSNYFGDIFTAYQAKMKMVVFRIQERPAGPPNIMLDTLM